MSLNFNMINWLINEIKKLVGNEQSAATHVAGLTVQSTNHGTIPPAAGISTIFSFYNIARKENNHLVVVKNNDSFENLKIIVRTNS